MLQLNSHIALKHDIKKLKKKHYDLSKFYDLIKLLVEDPKSLPGKYRNHALSGNLQGFFECHVDDNLILIYQLTKTEIILARLGTHSELLHK